MKVTASLFAVVAASETLSGAYEGSVPFIIDVNADFKGDGTADFDLNVKIASKRFTCPGEKITESDGGVTFTDIGTTGDCLGDGIRTDGKDPSKYTITKNSDGTLTFNSDGYPALKMTKKAKSVALTGSTCSLYEIADGSCGQSDLDCAYTKYAKAAEKALQDGNCADQGYTTKTGTQTKSYPVIGDIVISTYSKPALESSFGCSGTSDPAGPACYEGSAGALGLTETVKLNLLEVGTGSGKLEFTGSGIEGFTCSEKTYTKSGTAITLSDLTDCLPDHVKVSKALYCSDSDTMKVTVKDDTIPLPVTATLKKVACAGREVFASCTGTADPVITGETCYKGSAGALGLTETVTVKVKDFASSAGHIDFSGDGIEAFTCSGKTFTKSGQDITFSDSSDCLPSGIVVSGVKYCSDSDTMKITVKDTSVPIPISAIMSKIDCPSSVEV